MDHKVNFFPSFLLFFPHLLSLSLSLFFFFLVCLFPLPLDSYLVVASSCCCALCCLELLPCCFVLLPQPLTCCLVTLPCRPISSCYFIAISSQPHHATCPLPPRIALCDALLPHCATSLPRSVASSCCFAPCRITFSLCCTTFSP